jgi:mono/diheme cytochrome c family protein
MLPALLLLGAFQPTPVVPQDPGPRTTQDGVYAPAQAAEGREVYARECSQCHVLDYYTGEVVQAWEGVPVFDLYDLVRTKMPENNPGSLRPREYVALMAFILELNGMPAGEEPLSARSSVLKNIIFQWRDEP